MPSGGDRELSGGEAQGTRRVLALAEVAQAVARIGTPDEWGLRVVAAVEQATDWSRVFVFRLTGDDGIPTTARPTHLRLLAVRGVTEEQERQSRVLDLSGPSLSAQAVNTRAPVVTGRSEIAPGGAENMRLLGTPSYAVFPLIARDRVFGTLTLLDTELKTVSDEEVAFLQAVADTIATGLESAELYGAAEAASWAKDQFLSVASHELRTPLTPLKGLAQTILRMVERSRERGEPTDLDRVVRYLRTMDGQVDRLASLVNDLLDVSRIRTGRLALRLERVDLVALTRAVLDRFEAVADKHVVRFEPQAAEVLGTWDAGRLDQVITNLIANSLKYAPAGGDVTVSVSQHGVPGSAGAPEAHLSVSDPGIGIPRSQIDELFRPFHRLANAPPEHFGGMGLGLYISHDIVTRHGGRIWAESEGPGRGATFHVTLPLAGPKLTDE
jgi:signal transduction histidine kinase